MKFYLDAAALSRRERAGLVAELSDKVKEAPTEVKRRAKAALIARIAEIVAILSGATAVTTAAQEDDNDPQWLADRKILDQMIKRAHPDMDSPELADVVLAILNRWNGSANKVELIAKAVDEWGKYVLETIV